MSEYKLKHKYLISFSYYSEDGTSSVQYTLHKEIKILELDWETVNEGYIIKEIHQTLSNVRGGIKITNMTPLISKLYNE